MTKKLLLAGTLFCLIFLLSACGYLGRKTQEKAAEKAAEKVIEGASGGKADVDINKENVNINTDQGSMQTGEDVQIPLDFPKDVYVFEGKIKSAIKSNENNGYTLSIETDKPANEIKAAYEEKLKAEGWKITGSMDLGGAVSIVSEKDKRTASVMISTGDNLTTIILGVSDMK